ncbi:MAG: tRNA (adenosine(37)-N6)-dimethylallyltransferase MiaA [Clostridia bacterium]|nr:tRNA (adenosine(37)-N6)-dimethylallyltransferase MiaA [Clostridia bacterium]
MTSKLYEADGTPRGVAIVGPTASGKTAFSIRVARALDGEILSCDSMQIYRGMDIGTAKATAAERAAVPHHLLDLCEPSEAYSAADYATAALAAVREVTGRGHLPVFCGGTGLYLEAARLGRHATLPPIPAGLRPALMEEAAARGAEAMHAELSSVDPVSAAEIHPHNLRRVLRALEIFRATGRPKSAWDEESRRQKPALSLLVLGLFPADRAALHRRIDRRVDAMMEEGLLEEVRALYAAGALPAGGTAAQAIGYKELGAALRGECTVPEAVEEIKTATRRYARRQLTWFRATEGLVPLECDEGGVTPAAEALALDLISEFLGRPSGTLSAYQHQTM